MNRRLFLQTTLTMGAGACFAGKLGAVEASQRASVVEFGADATGKADATAAVRKAIASLSKANARLVFPAGKYIFEASSETAMLFDSFEGIEIYANNAELQFAGGTTAFAFAACHNVELHDMKLNWTGGEALTGKALETRCFSFEECETILLEGIAVQRAPGVGFAMDDCRDVRLDSVTVAPGKESRERTTTGGHAVAIRNCHGDVRVQESRFEGMGGDGINVYQSYWRIRERLDERSVVIESYDRKPLTRGQVPKDGSFVQFSSPESLQLLGEIAVNTVSINAQGATLNFAETLSPVILSGMLVCNVVDSPKVAIDHCRIGNNVGRGVVVHARSDVTNNHFYGCGHAAILLSADARRMEGPAVQTVNIRTNTFDGCNEGGAGEARGIITIDTAQERERPETPAFAVNSGIKIQSNIFKESAGAAIYAAGVDGLLIDGNTFGCSAKRVDNKGQLTAALVLRNVADSEVTGNTSNIQQSIVMVQCADTVATDGNRMLTAQKTA
jgi:uncharacterized protein (DUF1810 family)